MLVATVIALFFSLALSVEVLRWKPKSGGTQLSREALQAFWAICVVATLMLGCAYLLQRHYESRQATMELQINDLESQVYNLEQQVAEIQDNKTGRR